MHMVKKQEFKEAAGTFERVIAGREKLLGKYNQETLQTKYIYANTLRSLNKLKEAKKVDE